MVSQACLQSFSGSNLADYLRLSTGFNKLRYCINLRLPQQSFYSTDISCCRKFTLQYRELLYYIGLLLRQQSLQYWLFMLSQTKRRKRMYGHTYSKSTDQPGMVASLSRGQLNRQNEYFPVRVYILSRHSPRTMVGTLFLEEPYKIQVIKNKCLLLTAVEALQFCIDVVRAQQSVRTKAIIIPSSSPPPAGE